MFERKIDETISYLLRETIGDQDSITSRQIFASEMPAALRRMFDQDIDIWLAEEKERLRKGPHFRYDEPEVQELFEQITARAREYAYFNRDEYRQALEKNVKLLFNYACRPQWTLGKYFFADREHAPVDSILEGLAYFRHYEYYRIILREYFQKKNITVMNAQKFAELLEYIDQEVVRNFDSRKVAHLAEPVYELFSIGSEAEEKFAPVEALSLFFDDKNLRSIVERLDKEKEQRESCTLHDLVMLVSEVDYAMSFDISEIVHEQIHSPGVMKPERNITAGEDFEIPSIDSTVDEGQRRREIGDDEDDLDFIITSEENSVVAHAPDAMQEILHGDDVDEEIVEDLDITIEEAEDTAAEDASDTEAQAPQQDTEVPSWDEPDESEAGEIADEYMAGEDASLYTLDDEIPTADEALDEFTLDEEIDATDTSTLEDEELLEESLIEEAGSLDLTRAEERDSIPDMTLDDMEDFARSMGEETAVDEDISIDLGSDTSFDEDLDITDLPDDTGAVDDGDRAAPEDDELSIDWDKEAEDIPDVQLDEEDDERPALTDDTIPGISLTDDENLKPAEELLSQLDLEDLDDTDQTPPRKSFNDIPIVEDESPALPSAASDEDETENEPSVPPEDVIAEFGDVNQQISSSDRKKYIKKLFQKDEEAYDRAMRLINGKPTWREASEYIDEIFIKHDVDMYSRVAVKFTDDIYKRYLTK